LPLLLLPFAVVAAVMGLLPLRAWDYWWHVSIGRVVDVYGAVPDKNHYLFTVAEDAPSFIQPWLADWLAMWIHDISGIYSGLTARNLIAAAAFTLVGVVVARRAQSPVIGAAGAIAGFLVAVSTLYAGPVVFATLLLSISIAIACGVHDEVMPKTALIALPLIAALWANMDAAFLLPAGLAMVFFVASFVGGANASSSRADKRLAWGVTFAFCLAAPLLNPRGVELYGYLVNVAFAPQAGWDIWSVRLLPIVGVVLPVACARLARKLPALAEARPTAGPFKAVGAALLLVGIGFGMQRITEPQNNLINAIQPFEARQEQPFAGVVPPETPVIHAEILAGLAVVPRLFHDRRYAGFLIFELAHAKPAPIVFVDPRSELPPPELWRLYGLISEGTAWRGAFQQHGVNSAIVNKQTQSKLYDKMLERDEWELAYEDEYNGLFVRE
jgi:hypothetical protein